MLRLPTKSLSPAEAHQQWLGSMSRGYRSFQDRDLENAKHYFSHAVKLQPNKYEGWVNLAETCYQRNEYALAIKMAQRALLLDKTQPNAYQILGDALIDSGHQHQALPYLDRALTLNVNAGSLFRKARCLMWLYNYEDAEQLLLRATAMDNQLARPYTLLAIVQLHLGKSVDALRSIAQFPEKTASEQDKEEAYSTQIRVREYHQVKVLAEKFLNTLNIKELRYRPEHPSNNCADSGTLIRLQQYSEALNQKHCEVAKLQPMPSNWSEIEAMFMIPVIDSAHDFAVVRNEVLNENLSNRDYLETANMIGAIDFSKDNLATPLNGDQALDTLRAVHALCSRSIPDLHPGQFKFVQNKTAASNIIKRPAPNEVSDTLRAFFNTVLPFVAGGLARGVMMLMAIGDIHPFQDGNGRVALTLLNRELEQVGLQPILLNKEMGVLGQLGKAMNAFRQSPEQYPEALIDVIRQGQQKALTFISDVDQLNTQQTKESLNAKMTCEA